MNLIAGTDYHVEAEGLAFPEGPVVLPDGSVLLVEIAAGKVSRVSDGETQLVAEVAGGPNGAAIGPDGAIYLCNNGGSFEFLDLGGLVIPSPECPPTWSGGSIQRLDLSTGEVTTVYTECEGHQLRGPNDLVFDASGGMWFTDHGVRSGRLSDRTGVYWAAADGSRIVEVAFPLDTPNGIGLSPDGSILYVAETNSGRVWAWDVVGPGELASTDPFNAHKGRLLAGLAGHQLLDSLAVDAEGWVSVGTLLHGGITSISPDGSQIDHVGFDDPLVTNIAFGGEDLSTAFITLSGTGQLVSMPWPRPGLPLAF